MISYITVFMSNESKNRTKHDMLRVTQRLCVAQTVASSLWVNVVHKELNCLCVWNSTRGNTTIQCGRVAGELLTQDCDKIKWLCVRRMYLTSHRLLSVILHEHALHWQCLLWFAPYPQRSGTCCTIPCYQSQGPGHEIIGRRNDFYVCIST